MRIVVLTKPVPDPAAGAERLGPGLPARPRRRRPASSTATTSTRSRPRSSSSRRTAARSRSSRWRRRRRPTRCARRLRWAPRAASSSPIRRSPARATCRRRSACSRRPLPADEFDLLLAGLDTSDGLAGAWPRASPPCWACRCCRTPARSSPTRPPARVRVRRLSANGYDVIEAPMPARRLVHPGARRAALPEPQGDHGRALAGDRAEAVADLARCRRPGRAPGRRASSAAEKPAGARPDAGVGATRRGGPRDRRLPRRPEAHLMAPVILRDRRGRRTARSTRALDRDRHARAPARGRRPAGRRGPRRRCRAGRPRPQLATYLPRVVAVTAPSVAAEAWAPHAAAEVTAARRRRRHARPRRAPTDGRDLAGTLSALLGWGLLANASGVTWAAAARRSRRSSSGPRRSRRACSPGTPGSSPSARTRSRPHRRTRPGDVEARTRRGRRDAAAATVVERVAEAGAEASLEEARIVVVGGRGVGSPEGFGSSRTWRRRSVASSARRAPRSTPAGSPTPGRSARRARSSSRRSTSGSGIAARCSTGSACSRRRRSSPSTATRTRRSPSSRTCS